MRNISRFAAFLLSVALVFSLVSCTENSDDISENIEAYLAKEYPGREFAVIDYEKHSETSGRYEINVRCLDDGVEFMMYMYSSIAITDSYSVERANAIMEEAVTDELGKELNEKIESVSWHNIFADRATNYRFREIDLAENFTIAALDEIYEVELASGLGAEEVGKAIYDFVYKLCDDVEDNCEITRAEFVFKINRITYCFTTDSRSVLALGKDGVVYYIITNIEENSSSSREIEFEYLWGEAKETNEE